MISEERKITLAQEIENWCVSNKVSRRQLSDKAGINAAYLSTIKGGKWDNHSNGVPVPEWVWEKLITAIGAETETVEIKNYLLVHACLLEAKQQNEYRIIDGNTGTGKTYAIKSFLVKYPVNTYYLRCSARFTSKEFIRQMAMAIGEKAVGTTTHIREAIVEKLSRESNPIIIIDEAENLKDAAYDVIKDLHDELEYKAAIVLCGANDYIARISKSAANKKACFPQIFSRFSTSPLALPDMLEMDDMKRIGGKYQITEKAELQRLRSLYGDDLRQLFRYLRKQINDAQYD